MLEVQVIVRMATVSKALQKDSGETSGANELFQSWSASSVQ